MLLSTLLCDHCALPLVVWSCSPQQVKEDARALVEDVIEDASRKGVCVCVCACVRACVRASMQVLARQWSVRQCTCAGMHVCDLRRVQDVGACCMYVHVYICICMRVHTYMCDIGIHTHVCYWWLHKSLLAHLYPPSVATHNAPCVTPPQCVETQT